MKKQEEKRYLNRLWKKMQQHFKNFTLTQDPEELHQFRVQIKKIRSFLTLLEEDKKNKQLLKTFKPVKKVFASAGIIRDAFLHQQQGKEHHITRPKFYTEQSALQEEETKKLVSKSAKQLEKMKDVRKKLQKQLHSLSGNDIATFYKTAFSDTQHLLRPLNFSEQLHDGRKMLKHLMYNQHAVKDTVAEDLNINFKYIDELQDLLGQWHDNKLALAFFQKNMADKDLQPLVEKNQKLEKSIRQKARSFRSKVTITNHSKSKVPSA
jgi:CHAD domain-containing protein